MKGKKIISALQYVDPFLIEEAMMEPEANAKPSRFRFTTLIAACLCLVCCLGAFWFLSQMKGGATEETYTPINSPTEDVWIPTGSCEIIETDDFTETTDIQVAVIADGFYDGNNVHAYEACRQWCDENNTAIIYYHLGDYSTDSRMSVLERAVRDGNNVLIFPNRISAGIIRRTAELYPDVFFIGLDMRASDFGEDYVLPQNVYCVAYREEVAGFIAGFVAVKLGYTQMGFLGFEEDPVSTRYGYGFLQGVDYGAGAKSVPAQVNYCVVNPSGEYTDLVTYMERWYTEGTQAVFTCNATLAYVTEEAAQKSEGKIICAELNGVQQMFDPVVMPVSVTKEYGKALEYILNELLVGNWNAYGGREESLGLMSAINLEENYVQLSDTTQFGENFTEEDYKSLLADLLKGTIIVSDDMEEKPVISNITVEYLEYTDFEEES